MNDEFDFEAMPLTVLLDARHPFAYLALEPTRALAKELGIEVDWLPSIGQPLHAPSLPGPADGRGIRHRRIRALAIAREIEVYSSAQGLVLRDYYRAPDPTSLNVAWLWIREFRPLLLESFLRNAFRAYWSLELDPSNPEDLADLIASLGAASIEFRKWEGGIGRARVAALQESIRARGLNGSPCYLVEDEVFYGRQHLPMIRWILTGKRGKGPI
jgi:2-hydroxychromene-2-carboxylate isomerase